MHVEQALSSWGVQHLAVGTWLGRINVMKTWRINLGINEFIYKLDDDDVSVSCQLFYLVLPAGFAVRGRTCRTLIGQPFEW